MNVNHTLFENIVCTYIEKEKLFMKLLVLFNNLLIMHIKCQECKKQTNKN